jgi:hypothetical protein
VVERAWREVALEIGKKLVEDLRGDLRQGARLALSAAVSLLSLSSFFGSLTGHRSLAR